MGSVWPLHLTYTPLEYNWVKATAPHLLLLVSPPVQIILSKILFNFGVRQLPRVLS